MTESGCPDTTRNGDKDGFPAPGAPIAIVGMACRFPGAEGLTAFWRMLEAGESGVIEGVPGSGAGRIGELFPEGTGQAPACRFGAYGPARLRDRAAPPLQSVGGFRRVLSHEPAMTDPALPTSFASLEPFLDWALESERERIDRRLESSMDEIGAFYDAMISRIDDVLDHLDQHWGEDMPVPERRLYLLAMSLVEVSPVVELYERRESWHACDPRRFVPQRSLQSSS